MIVLVPILIAAIVAAALYFRKKPQDSKPQDSKPQTSTTAKQAYRAYYAKYDLMINPKYYNRVAFRLVNDTPVFLDDSPYTSSYLQPAERETLTDNDEVYCMVVVQSSLFGYVSHSNKKAKKAIVLLFRAAPFRELGRFGTGLTLSWRVDGENYHVVDDHFMECKEIENFLKQAIGEYEVEETY
jgi:hypothetical protein